MIGRYNFVLKFPDRQHTKRNFSQKWSSNTICGRFSIKISFLSKKHISASFVHFLQIVQLSNALFGNSSVRLMFDNEDVRHKESHAEKQSIIGDLIFK